MSGETWERKWQELSRQVSQEMRDWRQEHPRATLREIEGALDERLAQMRARMLEDVALASAAQDWPAGAAGPRCPQCGQALAPRGEHERYLQTEGGAEVTLVRQYGVCPDCGAGLFPPG